MVIKSLGAKYELDLIEARALDHYRQVQLIIQEPNRIGSVSLQRIAIPIIPGQFEVGMRSRSDLQNNMIF
jgi:hypothetical protein